MKWRIDGSGHGRRRRTVVLGNGSSRRRRLWRVRPKIGIVKLVAAPKRFLVWLRDAYVKMMMAFAESSVMSASYGGYAYGNAGMGKPRLKEYDEKMILEIYKSIVMAQDHAMVPRGAGKLGSPLSPVME
ncbi:hypothetical protein HS088_TW10G00550 [Tripterygium wilfordii]|uniref:Uncharacterized protein n=1 Tax=Tripterygium wilfordii TaxID=458696 RepID=A0A7J7D5D4_TRIWF|nr:hypothetical protein HS088_TW10G00550 [Tripterygium wilfordii]